MKFSINRVTPLSSVDGLVILLKRVRTVGARWNEKVADEVCRWSQQSILCRDSGAVITFNRSTAEEETVLLSCGVIGRPRH